jgi:hypothetical protein
LAACCRPWECPGRRGGFGAPGRAAGGRDGSSAFCGRALSPFLDHPPDYAFCIGGPLMGYQDHRAERDAPIGATHRRGLSMLQIAERFDITKGAVHWTPT